MSIKSYIRRAQRLNDTAVSFSKDGFEFISTQKTSLTRKEFVELLELSRWYMTRTLILCDINLAGADFSGLEINNVSFLNVDFQKTRFVGASFNFVSFETSFMFKSDFSESKWKHVIVSKSNMSHSKMNNIEMLDVQLRDGTNMFAIQTDMSGIKHILRCDRSDTIHHEIRLGDGLKVVK
jgi:uncharacterized protein YjbI with pentapeptide repeats